MSYRAFVSVVLVASSVAVGSMAQAAETKEGGALRAVRVAVGSMAQAAENADAVASGAQLSQADGARSPAQGGVPAPSDSNPSARGIEKKDIRRGMVIANPSKLKH